MITHASVVAWSSETFRGYGSPREDVSASDRESWSRLRSFEMSCSPHHYYRQPTPLLHPIVRAGAGSAASRCPAAHTTITGSPHHYYIRS